mmetsp:Transcript_28889/g.42825  ORF Transcript_28889/g.42825 Transcript_28889/m.42825 type:complete len:352 (+) Transcript_28889:257-1312(+)|eukprot:CAMPEP_0195517188 /NCGR_PEP_ID=MMETSP0794_2-20130614/10230_1 /TAXON_ID=515487 /ORGANISM="Stephanopyxis turris, Strain CCMP 815" /LENGTH=351 /DNA_ID=CAMNT_0040645957 /DNA_START=257 /DNA_END=1312 /DNA_ORIENTATION=+
MESTASITGHDSDPGDPSVEVAEPSNSALLHEKTVIREAGRSAINAFLEEQKTFSVIRISGKVVVFDTRIPIQLAFYALVEHDMQAAPLWDPHVRQFVGLITVTDFIDILRYYRKASMDVSQLSTRSIADILGDPNMSVKHRQFLSANTSAKLKHSCQLLHENSIDFLPIILPDDMRVLATLTYTNILEHLVTHFREQRRLFDDTIYDLGIGTYTNVVTVQPHQTLAECLHLLQVHDLSAVPVVDQDQRVINVYSRSDITFLATASDADDAIRNLNLTLGEILAQQRTDVTTPDRLHTCSPSHTLQSIFEYFAQLKFNRLIVTDDEHRCIGVVSARDLVAYFVSSNELTSD